MLKTTILAKTSKNAKNPQSLVPCGFRVVGAAGFEPATPTPPV